MSLKVPNLVRGCLDPISSHGCTLSTSLCSTCPENQLWIRTCSTWRTNPCATALSSLRLQHRTRTCSPWQWPNDPNQFSSCTVTLLLFWKFSRYQPVNSSPACWPGIFIPCPPIPHPETISHIAVLSDNRRIRDSLEKQLIYCTVIHRHKVLGL